MTSTPPSPPSPPNDPATAGWPAWADLLQVGLIAIDAEGRVVGWNAWMARHSNLTAAAALGRPMIDLLEARAVPGFVDAVGQALAGRTRLLASAMRRRGLALKAPHAGSELAQRIVLSPLPGGALIEVHDVSIASRRERELERRADRLRATVRELDAARREAELANDAKSRFFANMSHELRTPLNAILGFAEMILFLRAEGKADRLEEYLGHISASGRTMLTLVDELLDVARIEAGKLVLSEEAADLGRVVAGALKRLEPVAAPRRVALRFGAEAGETLRCDPHLVERMVVNLLTNAIKFSPVGAEVRVAMEERDGGDLAVVVADQGPGIAPEALARVVEPYAQTAEGRRVGGVGLGLAIVVEGMRLHGGRLDLANAPTGGLTARLWFPAARRGAA